MRRFVVLLLLVVVQLQLAWGAAAGYCAHEASSAAAKHVGHHEHRHAASDKASDPTGSDLGKILGTDPDCQSCHFAGLSVPPGPAATQLAKPELAPATIPQPSFDSFIPDGPERRDRRTPAAA